MAGVMFRGLLSPAAGGGGGGSSYNQDATPPALGGGSGLRLYTARGYGFYTDNLVTLATTAGQAIYAWKDYSGNNNHLTQTTSNWRPATGSGTKATSVHTWTVDKLFLSVPSAVVSGVTDGELFVLIKPAGDPSGSGHNGLLYFGGGNVGVYPFTDGNIYEGSGTTGRYAFTKPSGLTTTHVYSVRTSGTSWEALKNNSSLSTQSGNTVDWGSSPTIGVSISQTVGYDGEFGAVVFYAGARTPTERSNIVAALLAQAW